MCIFFQNSDFVYRPLLLPMLFERETLRRLQSLSFSTCANNSRCHFASLTIGGRIWVFTFHTWKTRLFARHLFWRCSYVVVSSSCTFMHLLVSSSSRLEYWKYSLLLFEYKNSSQVQLKGNRRYIVYRVLLVNDRSSAILSCEPVPFSA